MPPLRGEGMSGTELLGPPPRTLRIWSRPTTPNTPIHRPARLVPARLDTANVVIKPQVKAVTALQAAALDIQSSFRNVAVEQHCDGAGLSARLPGGCRRLRLSHGGGAG